MTKAARIMALESEVGRLRAELHQARQDVMYARGERDSLRSLVGARLARSPEVAVAVEAAVKRETDRMVEESWPPRWT